MPSNVDIFDVMSMMSQGSLENVYTTLPAKIVSYDHATQKAVVQPLIKRRDRDGDNSADGLVDMALISGVLVVQPSTPEGIVSFPIKAGWNVWLHFCSRSLDNYMFGDGKTPIDPQDYRVHQYSDCFATIGATTFPNAIGSDPSDFVIRFNVGTANENKVSLKANSNVEVVSPNEVTVDAKSVLIKNDAAILGSLTVAGNVVVGAGATGSFTTPSGNTVQVNNGIVTNIF